MPNFHHLGAGSRFVVFLAGFLRSAFGGGRFPCFFALSQVQGDGSVF